MSNEGQTLETEEQDTSAEQPIEINDWATAFEAFEQANTSPAKPDENDSAGTDDETANTEEPAAPDQQESQATDESNNQNLQVDEGNAGGSVSSEQGTDQTIGSNASTIQETQYTAEQANTEAEAIIKANETTAIKEVSELFKSKGILHDSQGRLGAQLYHTQRVNAQGEPEFFNPVTGELFTGDDPRGQAKKWLAEYNEDVEIKFNQIAGQRLNQLNEEAKPRVEYTKFKPTLNALDPVRKSLLEAATEDYAVKDNSGNIIGYKCDMNKAMEQVNRQIKAIQTMQATQTQTTTTGQEATPADPAKEEPSSPAVDMKAGGKGDAGEPAPAKSLEEAIIREQDNILRKLNEKGKK